MPPTLIGSATQLKVYPISVPTSFGNNFINIITTSFTNKVQGLYIQWEEVVFPMNLEYKERKLR